MSANQNQQKKMCKSPPKSQKPPELGSYEILSTNCTMVGSNNLNLESRVKNSPDGVNFLKKPLSPRTPDYLPLIPPAAKFAPFMPTFQRQVNGSTSVSPSPATPSPGYPSSAASPYSPGIKSPSPQNIIPQAFQQMVQIIHTPNSASSYQNHSVIARQTIITPPAAPVQQSPSLQTSIKIKPPQNILPKPPSTNAANKPRNSAPGVVQAGTNTTPSPAAATQLVLPGGPTLLPATGAGTLLLNQVPLLVQQGGVGSGVQLILRPGAAAPAAGPNAGKLAAPQMILQPAPTLLQHNPNGGVGRASALHQVQPQQLVRVLTANGMIGGLGGVTPTYIAMQQPQPSIQVQTSTTSTSVACATKSPTIPLQQSLPCEQLPPPKKKPKKKKKNKEPKLDLANIMKLSGIGDEDDVMFESDTSEPSEPPVKTSIKPEFNLTSTTTLNTSLADDITKRWTDPPDKTSQISVQQSLSDINAINQNLTQIGLINQNHLHPPENPNLANILQVLNQQPPNFSSFPPTSSFHKFTSFPSSASSVSQSQPVQSFATQKPILQHFNIPSAIPNIHVQNFNNSNLILNQLNQNANILTSNLPNFPGNITINNGLIPGGNLTLQNNLMPNFLPANLVQSAPDVTGFPGNVQRTGGFKLALSEDGRLILQHDPTLNQDLQSQLLLQSIFGINLQGGNLVLSNPPTISAPKPLPPVSEAPKKPVVPEPAITKTTHTNQTAVLSTKAPETTNEPNTYSYIVNLTPDQLETLKRNGQLTVNGQTIFMHRPTGKEPDKNQINRSPKPKTPKKKTFFENNKPVKNYVPVSDVQTTFCPQKQNPAPDLEPPPIVEKLNTSTTEKKLPEVTSKNEFLNGSEQHINVEQFLTNLNINQTNLGQLINQKINQELSADVNHKIVNISPRPKVAPVFTKIDLNPDENHQVFDNSQGNDSQNVSVPPLVAVKAETCNKFIEEQPHVQQSTVFQRVQTIQLTPQKQQLLKSVQLQIQALSARLQQKSTDGSSKNAVSIPETEIHTALRHLFIEQQKILATGKVIPNFSHPIVNVTTALETSSTQSTPTTITAKSQPIQNQKVYYHHGHQIIAINPNQQQTQPPPQPTQPPQQPVSSSASSTTVASPSLKIKKPAIPISATISPVTNTLPTPSQVQISTEGATPELSPIKKPTKSTFSKAQLIEQQLTTDQNGAMNPDITTPFSSKSDACKRLVRYHCYNQPVLSQKDLNKADEIFELTAKHFIEKFRMMVNKYKYLLFKESMREVQTSELMMIDRMFLAEEQQSFMKFQSDLKLQSELELQENVKDFASDNFIADLGANDQFTVKTENLDPDFNIKCGLNYFSDDSYENNAKDFEDFINLPEKDKSVKNSGLEGYNTTKIIGNFEIEINNSQESYTKNFRQKIIDNKIENGRKMEENLSQKESDEYDEWFCIQRELGYFPDSKSEPDKKADQSTEAVNNYDSKTTKKDEKNLKRSSSDSNRLESLKKYRVEKSSKVKKNSIIGEVKFEVRIEHKKVFPPEQKQMKSESNSDHSQKASKRCFDYSNDVFASKRSCVAQVASTCGTFHPATIKQEDDQPEMDLTDINDRSIDEQVQSAIDSILNLQQITSMAEKSDNQEANKTCKTKDGDLYAKTLDEFSETSDTLDEAVKSILS